MNLDTMADDANEAVKLFAHRSAGQHGRRLKEGWETVERIEITTQPAPLDPPGARGSVEFVGHEPGLKSWIRRVIFGSKS